MHLKTSLVIVLLLFVFSCSDKKKQKQKAFYYWQLNNPEQSTDSFRLKVDELNVEHFYIHYMDIGWHEQLNMPVPLAEITTEDFKDYPPSRHTPVVYVTNKVFEHITDAWCDTLVEKLRSKIGWISTNLFDALDSAGSFSELQIDCDWTPRSKDKYFLFLRKLKKAMPDVELSATIRMYPFKYAEKTGVPPVDRGALMCYNLGGINDIRTPNSIFDLAEFRKYFRRDKYPLPLDITFPVFGWHVWFHDHQFKGIIYDLPEKLPDPAFQYLGEGHYQVTTDTVLQGLYLREGDILRAEYPDAASLKAAAELITKQIPDYRRIIFFHWNMEQVLRYRKTIKTIYEEY